MLLHKDAYVGDSMWKLDGVTHVVGSTPTDAAIFPYQIDMESQRKVRTMSKQVCLWL